MLHADPMAPKRGLSAYMFFANEQRENVREENPGIAFGLFLFQIPLSPHLTDLILGQVGKVLGERWKALSPPDRQPYEDKAKADKERYDAEKASYAVSLFTIGCEIACTDEYVQSGQQEEDDDDE